MKSLEWDAPDAENVVFFPPMTSFRVISVEEIVNPYYAKNQAVNAHAKLITLEEVPGAVRR